MKNFLVLFLSLAVFTACSNDDDSEPNTPDPIIGTWTLIEASAPWDAQFCMEEVSTLTFNADNTGAATFYLNEEECAASNSTGNWSNRGNSLYTITVPIVEGDLQGSVNFTTADRFTFTFVGGMLTFEK